MTPEERYAWFAQKAMAGYQQAILPMVLDHVMLVRMEDVVDGSRSVSELYVMGVEYLAPDNTARSSMLVLNRGQAIGLGQRLLDATSLEGPEREGP